MKIALIPNMTRQNAPDVTKQVLNELKKLGASVFLSEEFSNFFGETDYITYCNIENSISECDIVLTVGGDGTFIKSAKLSSEKNKPLLCVNAGKLAYLAGLESTELTLLKDVVEGKGLGIIRIDNDGLATGLGVDAIAINSLLLGHDQCAADIGKDDLAVGVRHICALGGELAALGIHIGAVSVGDFVSA